jgi:hypothetical protein
MFNNGANEEWVCTKMVLWLGVFSKSIAKINQLPFGLYLAAN